MQAPAARNETLEDLREQALLALVWQVMHEQGAHDRVKGAGDLAGPVAGGHVERDVPVPVGERLQVLRAGAHHLVREVGQDRRAARVPFQDRPRQGACAGAQVQEGELRVIGEREQLGHEPLLRNVMPLAVGRLGGPVRHDVLGLPDGRVRVLGLAHAQQSTDESR